MKTKLLTIATMAALMLAVTNMGNAQNEDAPCLPQEHGLEEHQSAVCGVTQVLELVAGWNWVSFNVEITLNDLKAALVTVVPGTEITIKSKAQTTTYKPATGRWSGQMTWDLSQMYLIQVATDCEVVLQGYRVVPSVHPLTILGGGQYTYFAFPYDESMTLTNAFAGFAVQGDRVKAKSGNAEYQRRWMGTSLTTLEPGQGYMYQSATTAGDRTFVFPSSSSKANPNSSKP